MQILARDHGIGISTCYRYLHEAITALAAEALNCPKSYANASLPAIRTRSWMAPSSDPTALR